MTATWALRSLDEFSRFRNGKSIKPGTSGKYPAYGSNGLIGSVDDFMYEAAIILGRVGAYCGSVELSEGRFWASDNTIVVETLSGEADLWFLYYLLKDANLNQHAGGAAQPLLTQSRLKPLKFNIPSLPIQRRISATLRTYDDLIENNSRRIEILEEMARRLYEEWFVHFRFPGHKEVGFEESELGRIPEGWEYGQLRDVCDVKSGYAFKSGSFCADGAHDLVTIKNVQDGSFSPVCTNRLGEIPSNVPAHCFLISGDILLSLTGNVGRVCLVHSGEFLLNQRVAKLVEKQAELKAFVYFTFRDIAFRKRLENLASGVAQQNLSPVKTGEIGMLLPPKKLWESFSELTDRNLELMVNLENKNTNLRAQRDLLLPKLVSGEIDISDISMPDDKEVEAA